MSTFIQKVYFYDLYKTLQMHSIQYFHKNQAIFIFSYVNKISDHLIRTFSMIFIRLPLYPATPLTDGL
jgi:hypothetical protein